MWAKKKESLLIFVNKVVSLVSISLGWKWLKNSPISIGKKTYLVEK